MSYKHIELVLCQLAGLLAQLDVGHDGGHLAVKLLPALLHKVAVLLHHAGLALHRIDPGPGLFQLVEGSVGGLFGHNELRVGRGRFVPPASLDALEDIVDGGGGLFILQLSKFKGI